MNNKNTKSLHAYKILGWLLDAPLSGYDIKKLLSRAKLMFGTESNSQIYPILKRLEQSGCVKSSTEHTGKRVRKLYSITKEGKHKMLAWLKEASNPETLRDELVLKMSMGMHLSNVEWRSHLQHYQDMLDSAEQELKKVQQHIQEEHAGKADQEYLLMAYNYPLVLAKARRDWAKSCLQIITKGNKQK